MSANSTSKSRRACDLFEPCIRSFEQEFEVDIWSKLDGITFPTFTDLMDRLDKAITIKYEGQSAEVIIAKKAHVSELVGLAAESYRISNGATMSNLNTTNQETDAKTPIWNIVIGIIFAIAALGMAYWAFAVRNLTEDQRGVLRWLLPIASAISAGAFTGALTVKSKVLWPATVAAGGGFAVWLLSSYFLFATPQLSDFAITIYIRDDRGNATDVNGELWLELKNQEHWNIDAGQCLPRGIPSGWNGKKVRIKCKVAGFEQVDPTQKYQMSPDETIEVIMKKAD